MRRGNLRDGVHNKVTWKRSRDLLTKRCNNVTPRHGGDVQQWRYWVFHLGLTGGRTNGTLWIRTTETSWWRATETSLNVSFETCLRRRGDLLMERRCYVLLRRRHDVPIRQRGDVPLRCLGDVPSRGCWVFHLRRTYDVAGTYRETSYNVATTSCCRVCYKIQMKQDIKILSKNVRKWVLGTIKIQRFLLNV